MENDKQIAFTELSFHPFSGKFVTSYDKRDRTTQYGLKIVQNMQLMDLHQLMKIH